MQDKKRTLTNSQIIILGFLGIILLGAVLLTLPVSTKAGQQTTFLGALFTAVSATCVTGLVVYDTFAHWTLFGQIVIITLIQVGGLGFITIGTFIMISLHKKIGLGRRALIQESLSTLQIRGSVRLVRRIILGTLLFEGVGAVLLAIRFIPEFGPGRGAYYGIFHAISAFCNAGFDLMGIREEYSSFCTYYNDPLVVLTLSALIIIGGIGFVVWEDLYINKYHVKKYQFQTKVVLLTTAILLCGGTALFALTERNHLFAGMSPGDTFLAALFCAVTPRTAGFNTVDTAQLSNGGLFAPIFLMFIGGSPGSTAGGAKTTTLFVIVLYMWSYLMRQRDCVAFRRRMEAEAVKKASIVVFINRTLAIVGSMLIFISQDLPMPDVLFEVFSAGGTVGMTTGITRQLNAFSQIVIMCLMFCGRLGTLTFAMSFTERKKTAQIRYPEEQITIG